MAVIDMTGQTYGYLTVIKRAEKPKNIKSRTAFWECKCKCGNTIVVSGSNLRSKNTKSCGCLQKEITSEMNFKDLSNQKFGKLTVIKPINRMSGEKHIKYKCLCECGKEIETLGISLVEGLTTSCGCTRKKDITNQLFGNFKAIERLEKTNNFGSYYWKFKCIYCGQEKELPINYAKQQTMICSCQKKEGVSSYEKIIIGILNDNNIPFEKEKTFSTLINPKTSKFLRCDFFINKSYIIEIDGEQHFKQSSGIFGKTSLEEIQYLDNLKNQWCKENNIPIIRIPYYAIKNISLEDLLLETSKYRL